jgi:RNA polymerase sigma-54 factor
VHRFTVALRLLQHLEPVGVGARSLAECLCLQLKAMYDGDGAHPACATALRICAQPIELLARRDIKRLAQLCGDSDAQVRAAIGLIGRLEPKPGRRFVDVERNIVVPDVLVTKAGRGSQARFRVQLNPDVMPRLRVHDVYAGALRSHRGEGHQALQQRLQEARWFIKNIQQRFDTILRVSNAIVERQKNFFVHGELAMRPLVLREIADELGLHESTISRVTSAKYMATPFGTFELKYFFGSALGTETGGNASSTAVRALIKQFVAAENLNKPLSDSQISEMLKEQGIECARRTVAKYRDALRIAPANLRKSL